MNVSAEPSTDDKARENATTKTSGTPKRRVLLHILATVTMIVLATSTVLLYDENLRLRTDLEEQSTKITNLESYLRAYTDIDSNIKPPVTKLEAVAIALSSDGWNSSGLRGLEVFASLSYIRFFYANSGETGFEVLRDVNEPMDDYSPRTEYNITNPWGFNPLDKGTMWYRYIWTVTVHRPGPAFTIPPLAYYLVDASSGEIIPHIFK